MASLTDVLKQLAAQIAAIVYPTGTGQPSVAGFPIRVYPGWPVPEQLEKDLAAGIAHISVYPHGKDRSTTRYLGRSWIPLTAPVHTLTMTVSGSVVTLSGTISAQNIMINLNGTSYVYAVQQSDTLTSAATALAYLIPGATSSGPVITLTGAHAVLARVGGFGTAYKETKRQEQSVQQQPGGPRCSSEPARLGPIRQQQHLVRRRVVRRHSVKRLPDDRPAPEGRPVPGRPVLHDRLRHNASAECGRSDRASAEHRERPVRADH